LPSNTTILAFDTSAAHCAAAVLVNGAITATVYEPMARGQAENLMDILDHALAQAGIDLSDLDAIAVGTGPGNFTGIRISVSAARGLALSLGVPAIGVTTFEATWFGTQGPVVATVPAPRDHVYAAQSDLGAHSATLVPLGTLGQTDVPQIPFPSAETLVANMAQIAATRLGQDIEKPVPFYIKPADAAPSRDVPPQRLS
jgi:tRNA threonylcarbamoyladenosine biosynthesis protein TsaB